MLKFFQYFCASLLMLTACNDSKEEPVYQEMSFRVDTTLLGKRVTVRSQGIEFYSPKDFQRMDDNIFKDLRKTMLSLEGFRHFPLLAAMSKDQKGILLFLKLFPEDTSISHLTFKHVENVLKPMDSTVSVKKAYYTKDSINILQYLVDTGKSIDFKLFFHDKDSNLYELDYMYIDRNEYAKNIRAIESSIGSLKIN